MSGAGIAFTLTGADEVFSRMIAADLETAAAIEKAVRRLGLLVERVAKDEYVPVITGRLKSSIGGQLGAPQQPGDAVFIARAGVGTFTVVVGTNVIYAPIIEFGRKPGGRSSSRARSEYTADVKRTGARRTIGNGRHGPFLRPALRRAVEVGYPVFRAEFARITKA